MSDRVLVFESEAEAYDENRAYIATRSAIDLIQSESKLQIFTGSLIIKIYSEEFNINEISIVGNIIEQYADYECDMALELENDNSNQECFKVKIAYKHYSNKWRAASKMDLSKEERNYLNRLVQLSLYLLEMYEEGECGHSQVYQLLSPTPSINIAELKSFMFVEVFKENNLALSESAIRLHKWLLDKDYITVSEKIDTTKIINLCSPWERKPQKVESQTRKIKRSYLRLANYIVQMYISDFRRHSRVFEYYVPDLYVLASKSVKAASEKSKPYKEHVVPCAFIRDKCLQTLDHIKPDESLEKYNQAVRACNEIVRKLLVIVEITEEEHLRLDIGDDALKDIMPDGWSMDRDCIFSRLHEKGIAIDFTSTRHDFYLPTCKC